MTKDCLTDLLSCLHQTNKVIKCVQGEVCGLFRRLSHWIAPRGQKLSPRGLFIVATAHTNLRSSFLSSLLKRCSRTAKAGTERSPRLSSDKTKIRNLSVYSTKQTWHFEPSRLLFKFYYRIVRQNRSACLLRLSVVKIGSVVALDWSIICTQTVKRYISKGCSQSTLL